MKIQFILLLILLKTSECFRCLDDNHGSIDCDGYCLKTALIEESSPVSLHAIHRECISINNSDIALGCAQTYNKLIQRRTGPNIITCLCDTDLCNF